MIRRFLFILCSMALTACGSGAATAPFPVFQPTPGQGQYIRPDFLNAELPPRIPPEDTCGALLFQTLVGQHEGSIFFSGLPGRKRVIKPAQLEGFGYGPEDVFFIPPPLVEVREFLVGQSIYAPSISNLADPGNLGPNIGDRITIELDDSGFVQVVDCR